MKLQRQVSNFIIKYNLVGTIQSYLLDFQAELGELTSAILKETNYKNIEIHPNDDIKLELGDCLFSLLSLVNHLQVNAEECLSLTLRKYQKRFEEKGNIGSK